MADMGLDMLDDMDVDKVADMVANMVADKKRSAWSWTWRLTCLAHLLSFASLFLSIATTEIQIQIFYTFLVFVYTRTVLFRLCNPIASVI